MLDRQPEPSASDLNTLRDTGIFATRQLAKRQLTWLRSMPERQVIACDASDPTNEVLQLVHNGLQ
jgi:tRNA dimethylallyltransferase